MQKYLKVSNHWSNDTKKVNTMLWKKICQFSFRIICIDYLILSDNFFAYEFNSVSMLKMKIRKLKLIKVNTYLMSDMTGFTSD